MEKYCIWNYLVTRLLDNFKEGLSKLEFKINKKASLIEERFVAISNRYYYTTGVEGVSLLPELDEIKTI